ncbi:hypothetical protein BDZ91DRAFT_786612 [Kalaharituber pfeilii]|nr:hypothetical protein BDZ91DRAFT_786612 [Kalaharituber pfeilii]
MKTTILATLVMGLFSALARGATYPKPLEQSNSDPFTVMALNASYPDIDGKFIWYFSGYTYLDRGVQNPRYSYPLAAKLEENKLIRLPVSGDPGAGSTIGNLNFGTSGVCCNYAQLRFHSPETLPPTSRTTPFYIDSAGNLVWENPPYRQPWYLCGRGQFPGDEKLLYFGLPYYDFDGEPHKYCVAVKLAVVRPL